VTPPEPKATLFFHLHLISDSFISQTLIATFIVLNFVGLIVMLIKSWIKNIRVFTVSIDYDEYFEVVSIVPLFFFSTLHIFGVALYFQNIRA
jgi:hypothetical protein